MIIFIGKETVLDFQCTSDAYRDIAVSKNFVAFFIMINFVFTSNLSESFFLSVAKREKFSIVLHNFIDHSLISISSKTQDYYVHNIFCLYYIAFSDIYIRSLICCFLSRALIIQNYITMNF